MIHPAVLDEAQNVITPESAILYGSACMFFMVKAVAMVTSKLHKEEEKPAAPAGPTTEELLAEIRDLLKEKNT